MVASAMLSILTLGNKWCKDNSGSIIAIPIRILTLGNKWCKDNLQAELEQPIRYSYTWE